MAIDFPSSGLTVGQLFNASNGGTYQWTGTIWLPIGNTTATIYVGDTPPASPIANQFWFNSALGQTFVWYNDGNTSQWVPANPVPTSVVIPGMLTLYSEALGTGSTAFLNVAFPSNAKRVELEFFLASSTGADGTVTVRGAIGGTANSAASYHQHYIQQLTTNVQGGTTYSTVGWGLGSGSQLWGSLKFQVPALGFGEGHWTLRTAGAVRYQYVYGLETDTSMAPFTNYYFSSTLNFSNTSYLRCYVGT